MAIRDNLGIWVVKSLGDRLANLLRRNPRKEIPLQGRNTVAGFFGRRNFSLPIEEIPVRNPDEARELLEMVKWSRHARHCLSYAIRDVFGSSDGDDRGWAIAPDIEGGDKIDPQVYEIITALKERRYGEEYVIGGDKMQRALHDALAFGDSFLTWSATFEKGQWGIDRTMYLPTWEMFREETDQRVLTHYEQRIGWGNEVIEFDPLKVVQISHERMGKYGQSVFLQSLPNWADLKDGLLDKADAARAIGINPNIHVMPEGTSIDQRDSYQQQYEDKKKDGAILDLYMDFGGEIKKLSTTNPDLTALATHVENLERKMVLPGFPIYYFPEFEGKAARDIAGQPALAYMRMRNQWCSMIATALRQIIDIELIFKLGYDEFLKRGKYRIVFPLWKLNLSEGQDDESNLAGMTDLDRFVPINGNGHKKTAQRYF